METYLGRSATFEDIEKACGGKVVDKQEYDLTFGKSRFLRTTYFGEGGERCYVDTGKITEPKTIEKRSDTVIEVKYQEGVHPSEIEIHDDDIGKNSRLSKAD